MGKRKLDKQQTETPQTDASATSSSLFASTTTSATSFDSELDAFFKTPALATLPPSTSDTSAFKRKASSELSSRESLTKKAKERQDAQDEHTNEELGQLSEPDTDEQILSDSDSHDKSEHGQDSATEAREVEDQTLAAQPLPTVGSDGEELPVHESLIKSKDKNKKKNKKILFQETQDETPEQQQRRTLFIGNVSVEALKSRSLQKELRKLIEQSSPYPSLTRVSSLRFRSIAFAVPTDDYSGDSSKAKSDKRKERSQNYREALASVEGKPEGSHDFLNHKQKRKVAYINQQLNTHANTVNAYITLAHPEAVFNYLNRDGAGTFDRRLTAPVLTALVVSAVDGQLFEGHHLRVDLAKPLEPAEVLSAGLDKATGPDGSLLLSTSTGGSNDPKRTIFVGNLDFEANEEDLRVFFEKLVTTERGAAPRSSMNLLGLDGTVPIQPFGENVVPRQVERSEWVRTVRIVRDRATQMGKGFGYVRFFDTESVDEVVALYEAEQAFLQASKPHGAGSANGSFRRKFKFHGRPLRLSRCKSGTNTGNGTGAQRSRSRSLSSKTNVKPSAPFKTKNDRVATSVPKLSEAEIEDRAKMLAKLGKEDRAAVKRSDTARQARRMDKKMSKKAAERIARSESSSKTKVKIKSAKSKSKKGGKISERTRTRTGPKAKSNK